MTDTTPSADTVDPSVPLAALGGRKQRKIVLNHHRGTFGYRCRVCPGPVHEGGHPDAGSAAEAFNTHHATAGHQKHLRILLRRHAWAERDAAAEAALRPLREERQAELRRAAEDA